MPVKADLHLHSISSDGVLSPSLLVQKALDKGITTLAITDHDTFDGFNSLSGAEGQVKIIQGA